MSSSNSIGSSSSRRLGIGTTGSSIFGGISSSVGVGVGVGGSVSSSYGR